MLRCNALLRSSIILLACAAGPPWLGHAHAAADPAPSSAAGGQASSPDPREPLLAQATLELLEREHLARKRIDDGVSRVSFATYLDRLDSGKMFLLKADRDALGKYADRIDDQLRAGALDLGHEGQRILIKRVSTVQAWVAELLASPLDLSNQEDLELDPEKTAVAATEAELKDRWRRRLEFEVLERVAQMEARLETAKRPAGKSATKSATKSAPSPLTRPRRLRDGPAARPEGPTTTSGGPPRWPRSRRPATAARPRRGPTSPRPTAPGSPGCLTRDRSPRRLI